jgi:hypothetical protein
MQLPALRNSVPASLNGMSIEDYIRNSTRNLQQIAATVPGSGIAGAVYLGFDGTTGVSKLNKEAADPKSLGRILVPNHGLFEGCIEWANGSPLQKVQRQMVGVHYDEPMSEALLPKPLSPNAYRKENDGPTLTLGFVGFMLDDGATVMYAALDRLSRRRRCRCRGEHPADELSGAGWRSGCHASGDAAPVRALSQLAWACAAGADHPR